MRQRPFSINLLNSVVTGVQTALNIINAQLSQVIAARIEASQI